MAALFDSPDLEADDFDVRYEAYRRIIDAHPEALDQVLERLSVEAGDCLADSIRRHVIWRAGSPDERAELLARPDFQTPSVRAGFVDLASSHAEIDHVAGTYQDQPDFLRRKAADAHAILDAKDEDAPEERLIEIVESGSRKGQLALLDRERLPSTVVSALALKGASRSIRNIAMHWSRRRTY
jgi:hypothetical protein